MCTSLRNRCGRAAFTVITAHIPTGEDHKTFTSIAAIYDQLLPARLDRQTPIIALGGGVIGDMTGFAAATILRGVPFIQVPTTLLAMVDASVGGKTGINHAVGKNLIGAFYQPIAVLIDPEVLKTLPPRELRNGLAECIKHEIIRDADGFAMLEQSIDRALKLDIEYLTQLVAHNVSIKAAVVAADPFEKAERAHLNFGHTFGHAFENVSHYAIAHGEGVALGMVAASRLARKLGMLDDASVTRIEKLIEPRRFTDARRAGRHQRGDRRDEIRQESSRRQAAADSAGSDRPCRHPRRRATRCGETGGFERAEIIRMASNDRWRFSIFWNPKGC